MNYKNVIAVLIKIGFIALALYVVLHKIDVQEVLALLSSVNIPLFVLGILLSMLSLAFSAIRSRMYMHHYGLSISKSKIVALYYAGTFLNIVLPGGIGGDGYKIIYLSKHYGFSKMKAFRVVLYERVNGFFALAILGFLFFYFSNFASIEYLTLINTTLLMAITPCYYIGIRYVLKDEVSIAFKASGYSFIIQIIQVMMSYALLYAFDIPEQYHIDFVTMFIAASILAILPISIGGIGVRELTMLYGVSLLGAQDISEQGVAYAFALFVVYVLSALPGLFATLKLGLGSR
jgi:uncharacterized membrane protein YbhN (UPF0104 family)